MSIQYSNIKGSPGGVGVSSLTAGTGTSVSTSTGAVTVWFNSTNFSVQGTTTTFTVNNATSSTSPTTGALVIGGGAGINGDLNVGGQATVNNSPVVTAATFGNYTLAGSTGTLGNLIIANSATIQGSYQSTSSILGNALQVTNGGIGAATIFASQAMYINGAPVLTTVNVPSLGVGSIVASNATLNYSSAGAGLQVWSLGQNGTGTVYIQNTASLQYVTNIGSTTTNAITINNAAAALSTLTGALVIQNGGLGLGGNLYAGGNVVITSNGLTVSTTTGALTVAGGVGIGGGLYVGGAATINNQLSVANSLFVSGTANSNSTSSGALQVIGGAGIGGNLQSGGSGTFNFGINNGGILLSTTGSGIWITGNKYSGINLPTSVQLESYSTSIYRTARYLIQIVDSGSVHISEITLFYAGTTVYKNEYGISTNNGELGTFDATIIGGAVTLAFTPYNPINMSITWTRTLITN